MEKVTRGPGVAESVGVGFGISFIRSTGDLVDKGSPPRTLWVDGSIEGTRGRSGMIHTILQ